ncbi:MAG: hypothetical protein P0S93_00555 [Candidatus Neptunochlamydia sp.]|nr:hypothetical protein [Candidatus Neptunochlamydia sp.]
MTPLARQLRPQSFDEVSSKNLLVGEKDFLSKIIENGKSLSILLWDSSGCGKTTIPRFILPFTTLS